MEKNRSAKVVAVLLVLVFGIVASFIINSLTPITVIKFESSEVNKTTNQFYTNLTVESSGDYPIKVFVEYSSVSVIKPVVPCNSIITYPAKSTYSEICLYQIIDGTPKGEYFIIARFEIPNVKRINEVITSVTVD
jgi:hypothetical protein